MLRDHKRKFDSERADTALPFKARPVTDLSFNEETPPSNPTTVSQLFKMFLDESFHSKVKVRTAHKASKLDQDEPAKYYVKSHHNPQLSQLESYSAAVCRLVASDKYVPATRVYYDNESNKITGVASKELPGFQSIHDNPLTKADIKMSQFDQAYQQRLLLARIDRLREHLNVSSCSYFSRVTGFLFATPTSSFLADLTVYQGSDNKFSNDALDNLNQSLSNRVAQSKCNTRNIAEFLLISEIKASINLIQTLVSPSETITIPDIEAMDAADASGQAIAMNATDLAHYRAIKGLATALTTRYIFKEGDSHAKNMAKDGKIIDFDLTKQPLSFPLKSIDPLTEILRSIEPASFKCTAGDIRSFPVLNDTPLFYWPTVKPDHVQNLLKTILKYLRGDEVLSDADAELLSSRINELKKFIVSQLVSEETNVLDCLMIERSVSVVVDEKITLLKDNIVRLMTEHEDNLERVEAAAWKLLEKDGQFFTADDNKIFSDLAFHPVFEYHKYRTLLKFLLIDPEVYNCIAELHIGEDEDVYIKDAHQFVSLRTAAAEEDILRREEIESVLDSMPEFHEFLVEYGEVAVSSIVAELNDVREKYLAKVDAKPYYQRFVDALDPDYIQERFNAINNRHQNANEAYRF